METYLKGAYEVGCLDEVHLKAVAYDENQAKPWCVVSIHSDNTKYQISRWYAYRGWAERKLDEEYARDKACDSYWTRGREA